MERLQKKVHEAEVILADLHDSAKTVWGTEHAYPESELYERVRKFLCS